MRNYNFFVFCTTCYARAPSQERGCWGKMSTIMGVPVWIVLFDVLQIFRLRANNLTVKDESKIYKKPIAVALFSIAFTSLIIIKKRFN